MRCPYCNTPFPPPSGAVAAQIRCARCGGRLFSWLGDPFGNHDFPTPASREGGMGAGRPAGQSTGHNGWIIAIVVATILFCCCCYGLPVLSVLFR